MTPYTPKTTPQERNTIEAAVELLELALNDGDCVADALATVFENTLQVAEWNNTRKELKAFLSTYHGTSDKEVTR